MYRTRYLFSVQPQADNIDNTEQYGTELLTGE